MQVFRRRGAQAGPRIRRRQPRLELLEIRVLQSGTSSDYALSGSQWANPSHITYSFALDGVPWGDGTNDLNAVFNQKFGNGTWQRQIAKALATWESVANIEISPVQESGAVGDNTPGQPQGDPRFGDIRFGGYPYANNTTELAQTFYPSSPGDFNAIGGDLEINTALGFNIGSDYDLYSVMQHETGHALGMAHAQDPAEVMYPRYQGIRTGLGPGDIAGMQAMYGARTPDRFQSQGQGLSASNPIDVTGELNATGYAAVDGVSLATIGDTEYFSVVAPAGATGEPLSVTAAASSISMLSPSVTLLDAQGHTLASAGDPSAWSDDATASLAAGSVVAGQRYVIAVTGATNDVFSVGAYELRVVFGNGTPTPPSPPASPSPPTSSPPGSTGQPPVSLPPSTTGSSPSDVPPSLPSVPAAVVTPVTTSTAASSGHLRHGAAHPRHLPVRTTTTPARTRQHAHPAAHPTSARSAYLSAGAASRVSLASHLRAAHRLSGY